MGRVSRAYLEAAGHITGTARPRQPRVVEVRVEEGVQTVRIELRE